MDKGAHFFQCDFQVHTPRDLNWKGAGAATPDERRSFAEDLVAACRTKGLQAIAVTDHHDVALFREVQAAALAETDEHGNPLPGGTRLTVFPGMELTLGVPCQALIVLDADFPVDFLEQVAFALGITPAASSEAKHAPTQRLEHITDFEQIYDVLSQRDFLKGRFFVMPHVGESGDFSLIRKGFAAKYKSMPCVGGYVDGSVAQHGKGARAIVCGQDKLWGNKAIGLFQTSDNRRRDFADLGKHATWVKWARPTAEALRQACLARESRLSHVPPQLPSIVITSLEVSNSRFMGPIVLEINPQYNALIGGRGTGKSTVLEYLRWGLCDQPPAGNDGDLPEFQRRARALVQNTLAPLAATVSVSFAKNGIEHVVRRKSATNELFLKIGNGDFAPCTEADVRDLLPVHAYSQKQLSSVGVRLEELLRFVKAPVKQQLNQLETNRRDLRAQLRVTYDNVSRQRELAARINRFELERQSLSIQIDNLRGELKGLSDQDRGLIASQALREQEVQVVNNWNGRLDQARLALRAMEEDFADIPLPLSSPDTPEGALLQRMHSELTARFVRFRGAISELRQSIDADAEGYQLASYAAALAEWDIVRAAANAAYEGAKQRSAAHEGTLSQMRDIEDRIRQLDGLTSEAGRALARLADPSAAFRMQRAEWDEVHSGISNLMAAQCAALTDLSKGLIRATLRKGHDVAKVDIELRAQLRGTKLRTERYDSLWARVRGAPDSFVEWSTILDELELLARIVVDDETNVTLPSTPILDAVGFTLRERQAIARVLTPEGWLSLFLEPLDDLPEFEYRAREGEYIRFNVASAGQQATALMYVLLNQSGPPLLIDQPEDDLDNKVMDDIVREIWQAKSRRQLIFSSHNANLVVNGDAELVVCCDYRVAGDQSGGKIKLEGAIDVAEINTEITAVMEGGREAFGRRRAKYGF
jgi:type III restriction enzyme